jgi:type III pantothenate kinase
VNLIIDLGNTLAKTAIFNENELSSFSSFEKFSIDVLKELLVKNPSVKNVILSSVVEHNKNISDYLKSEFNCIELTHETKIPIENLYQSPETLGKDRLASAVGANSIFRDQNVLSIDAGTCIKYDFVNKKNQYLGGGISPGIEMRFKALNQFTDKLPLLNYASSLTLLLQEEGTKSFDKLIGENTEESILSGVMNGVVEEVKGIMARYEQQYPDVRIVFTGGYLKFFEKTFNIGSNGKSSIFADSFLVLKGLNQILEFNAK